MKAVILAGGVGSRLQSLTGGKPKCLADIGGQPLILHQLEMLADHGVGPVLVVLGYKADEVRKAIGQRAETIVNEKYEETNSLYSLSLARKWVDGPFVLLNCDLFCDPEILSRIVEEPGNVLAYDSTSSRGREQTKVAVKQRKVLDLGKDLPAGSARGESLGLLKFDQEGATNMMQMADYMIRDGHEKAWVIEATRAVCQMVPIYGINVAGLAWTEIDFPHDLDVARREVWPKIWKRRWRRLVYWRRIRWVAATILLAAFATSGWLASTRLGPPQIDWETVPVQGASPVYLERNAKMQLWHFVPLNQMLKANVTGPEAIVETRLVLPDSVGGQRYVIELSVDDVIVDWRALKATRDTSARLGERHVGDKDRISVAVPPGSHRVGVRMVAGHGRELLARVRQPDTP